MTTSHEAATESAAVVFTLRPFGAHHYHLTLRAEAEGLARAFRDMGVHCVHVTSADDPLLAGMHYVDDYVGDR